MDRSSSFFFSMLNDLINSYTFNRMGLETLASGICSGHISGKDKTYISGVLCSFDDNNMNQVLGAKVTKYKRNLCYKQNMT